MKKIRFVILASVAVSTGAVVVACGENTSSGGAGSGGMSGTGGSAGSGGMSGTGGTAGSGGMSGTGGSAGSGGMSGTGGTAGSGGMNGTGGTAGSGGMSGTGGFDASVVSDGSAGISGSGGTSGSGGLGDAGGDTGTGGTGGTGGTSTVTGPCDIYETGGTSCIAAHSTVRALYGGYSGDLYQVRRESDNAILDIAVLTAGGFADSAAQDAFCTGTRCVFTIIYDQSGNGNHLESQDPTSSVGGADIPTIATTESLTVSGHKVYSLYIKPKNSFWRNGSNSGVPTGSAPQGIYMVTSGTHNNAGCCFGYGNSSTSRTMEGGGTMDAVNFSSNTMWGSGAGPGPWVMADLEGGLFAQGDRNQNPNNPTQTSAYVTAVTKNNGTTEFAIKGGDATSGSLGTYYKGPLPAGYSPMRKQGAIVLGSGGDCCLTNTNQSEGTFYEGCIVSGYPSDETEDAVQANIVSAGYGE